MLMEVAFGSIELRVDLLCIGVDVATVMKQLLVVKIVTVKVVVGGAVTEVFIELSITRFEASVVILIAVVVRLCKVKLGIELVVVVY